MNIPTMYDYNNFAANVVTPSTIHVTNTALSKFFQRRLLQKAMSVFKWEMPENWAKNYFLYSLYCFGSVTVFNTSKFGVIPQYGTPGGFDVFYRPRRVMISNALFDKTYNLVIGQDCELVHLQPDYGGIMDTVCYYADQMALASESVSINMLNSRLAWVFTAKNKAAAEAFKKMFDQISSGEPAVVQDTRLQRADGSNSWDAFAQNVGQNYIADRLLSDLRKLEAEFDTIIGVPNANTDKRERLISDEVNANNVETQSMCDLWLEMLKECCEKVNAMFDCGLAVDWRYPQPIEEGAEYD